MRQPYESFADQRSAPHERLRGVRFVKITGPTGDWIVLHDLDAAFTLSADDVRFLCERAIGIGGIGVVALYEPDGGNATTTQQRRLASWTANGDTQQYMAEPARAATAALAALKRLDRDATSHHVFATDFGVTTTVYTPRYIGVDIGQWSFVEPDIAKTAGSDALVMVSGLTDPRPGLSLFTEKHHITIAVESLEELEAINLSHQPSVEPPTTQPLSISIVVPHDPLVEQGMGQLKMRHYADAGDQYDLSSAAAATTMAFQLWSGLDDLGIWKVETPSGNIVVQLHDQRRLSTFASLNTAFFGQL